MSLDAGVRLGPFEILAPLGAGGMGEVYKARDLRLERTIAIKVLPERVAASPELRRRFEREARAISQLSHPNICTVYDVGRQDGVEYLVMEYLEGKTLAARLLAGRCLSTRSCGSGGRSPRPWMPRTATASCIGT